MGQAGGNAAAMTNGVFPQYTTLCEKEEYKTDSVTQTSTTEHIIAQHYECYKPAGCAVTDGTTLAASAAAGWHLTRGVGSIKT